jgi:Ca2+-binding RTX toxin-like protein
MKKTVSAFVSALILISGTTLPASASNHNASTGQRCTIVGTSGNDTLVGTSRKDVICGLGGNDVIKGNGGNDIIDGGAGNDKLYGGAGNDTLIGGKGNDTLNGDAGKDKLSGSAGNDTLVGGTGNDTFIGGTGTDTVSYSYITSKTKPVIASIDGAANDGVSGERDNIRTDVENITGSSSNDTLTGSSAKNVLSGGSGKDTINGGAGNDTINGGAGDDVLNGDLGNDTMDGGPGADTLVGGPGVNACTGNGASWDVGDNLDFMSCEDLTPPRIVSFSVTPANIDTRFQPAEFIHVLRIEDDLSGFPACGPDGYTSMVSFASVFYRNNEQQHGGDSPQYPVLPTASASCSGSYNGAVTVINNLTSDGRVLDITMTVKTTFPRFSRLGSWDAIIEMRDMTTNYSQVTMPGPINGGE